jgi:gluconolactonase
MNLISSKAIPPTHLLSKLAIAAGCACAAIGGAWAAADEARWTCPGGPFGDPIPDGAQITRIDNALPLDAFNLFGALDANVEGPVWKAGALYFSEFGAGANPPPTRVIQLKGGNPGTVFLDDAGTNGLAVDRGGRLYGASHKVGGIVRLGAAGDRPAVVVDRFKGQRFNSPNDLTIRSDGTIYFTDPTWQAPVPPPQAKTRVYRLPPGASAATVVDDRRLQPNGITLSPDEKTLYVSSAEGLFRYKVAADGSVGQPVRFAPQILGADGMVADCAGNLYVTSTDVVVLDPTGAGIGRLRLPAGAGTATNLAFGGSNHRTLFITAMGLGAARGLFKVELGVPGLPY